MFCASGRETQPAWSLIYLHSFSQKGTEYLDFPHYFNVGASKCIKVLRSSIPRCVAPA